MVVIGRGVKATTVFRLSAHSVWPTKAGMAVATSTTELGKAFFSTVVAAGVFMAEIALLLAHWCEVSSLHRNTLSQIPRLIHIRPARAGGVVRQ